MKPTSCVSTPTADQVRSLLVRPNFTASTNVLFQLKKLITELMVNYGTVMLALTKKYHILDLDDLSNVTAAKDNLILSTAAFILQGRNICFRNRTCTHSKCKLKKSSIVSAKAFKEYTEENRRGEWSEENCRVEWDVYEEDAYYLRDFRELSRPEASYAGAEICEFEAE